MCNKMNRLQHLSPTRTSYKEKLPGAAGPRLLIRSERENDPDGLPRSLDSRLACSERMLYALHRTFLLKSGHSLEKSPLYESRHPGLLLSTVIPLPLPEWSGGITGVCGQPHLLLL